ncbi:heparan-alpha-glucosaminide N-acetyltransferase domain-containing protein [Aestuariibaculum sp. M13]|uniref:DUF1624 domain-containing protein n=1 Tax=Aestuariibaculum sp. M13 TaxID=2967132 RepID=UPI002159CB9E|nr:heparan-alpha-glucosaminide N-acetyltransferase domain-containing protein [Aestuariibaculum sp. M13]MCR8666112.1 heparan-alpha-glucosaminide N-acetyltransferase domain-containing protein [Aestuariibaculum sp. M13]
MIKSNRIESIDILRGLVMIIMALDHTRDYFHYGAFFSDPTNLETTNPILFFTRFITHYCAPVFILLAGTSAFLFGSKKTKPELFKFLFTRGIWLIFLEIFLNNLLWKFDITYSVIILQVIWAIGLTMLILSFLIFLNTKLLLLIGSLIIAGHNALDNIVMQGNSFSSVLWYALHQQNGTAIGGQVVVFAYPILPWLGVMILGFCLGQLYLPDFDTEKRKQWLLKIGLSATVLFFIIRGINIYGDLVPWSIQDTTTKTILSFFKVTKYPPSLSYLLITLGPALLFLYAIESVKNKLTDFMIVFGRVPLFYYFLHIFVIHVLAIVGILIFGGDWKNMIITQAGFNNPTLKDYGYSLLTVYLVWISIIILLYFPCKTYMIYKVKNKDKWWLSYL